jgi:hypothetical protein
VIRIVGDVPGPISLHEGVTLTSVRLLLGLKMIA